MILGIIMGVFIKVIFYDYEIQFEYKEINVNNMIVFDQLVGIFLLLLKSFKSVCKYFKCYKILF